MANEQKERESDKPEKKDVATSIIRIAGRDINGRYRIVRALMQIKGIGYNMAHALALSYSKAYGVSGETELGMLSDTQLNQLEGILKDSAKMGVPSYMLNRRRDSETGNDMHLIGTDLTVRTRQDIDHGIKIQTWVGSRHQFGQKVRGQRTRSTGRTGATVGVIKKAAQAQLKEAAKKERAEKAAPAAAAGTPAESK